MNTKGKGVGDYANQGVVLIQPEHLVKKGDGLG